MKICMLSRDFLPNIGGIAAHVYELSKALVKQGNEVYVITYRKTLSDEKYDEIDGIKVHRLYKPNIKFIGFGVYSLFEWFKLRSLIKKNQIKIVHSHTVYDTLIMNLCNEITKIETEHSSGFLRVVEKGSHIWIYKWAFAHVDHIIAPSKELVDICIKTGVKQEKTAYIPNGVDIEKFNQKIIGDKIRADHKINKNDNVVLCPRRLVPKNGVHYLIKALPLVINQNTNIKCLIVGDGPEKKKLICEAEHLNVIDNIIFTGDVSNTIMPEYYAAADIVVLPSLKEATSIAGLEAMASGKPLVGTSVGGIPQIINDGITGILVSSKDSKKLAEAINLLLKDDEKRYMMGMNARKEVEDKFYWDTIAKKTSKIYDETMNNSKYRAKYKN